MAQGRFYILDQLDDKQLLQFVCQLVCEQYRQGMRIAVMASDQAQAEALDELLWQLPADAFIAHNLLGEGPPTGTPVMISWPQQQQAFQGHRQCLINLAFEVPEQAQRSRLAIDFVPTEESARAQARERYKQYRQLGFTLNTEQAGFTTTG